MNVGDIVHILDAPNEKLPTTGMTIDLMANDEEVFSQSMKLARAFSLENRKAGGEFLGAQKYNMTNFLRNTEAFKREGLVDYFSGNSNEFSVTIFKRAVNINGNQINMTWNIIESDVMTNTDTYFGTSSAIFGMKHANGGLSRHMEINFNSTSLRDDYMKYINGQRNQIHSKE